MDLILDHLFCTYLFVYYIYREFFGRHILQPSCPHVRCYRIGPRLLKNRGNGINTFALMLPNHFF